jgi:DNA invertase Pin-like site-specific DNA recombinase
MLDRLSRGDEVVVWKLDRLGRSTRHLLELLAGFKARGIKFRSLRDGIATDPDTELGGAIAQAMVTIISAFAQLERDQLHELTRVGMAVAAANGRRPCTEHSDVVATLSPSRPADEVRPLRSRLATDLAAAAGSP